MNNEKKIKWINNNGPYVVLWLRISRVADFYYYYFNHWKPRAETGYLDADCNEKPSPIWSGYAKSIEYKLTEQGFLLSTPDFEQQRVPFLMAWGGRDIPDNDPRWDDDEFEPPPVEATIHECLFGDP
ncbi:MAG: hypothetical protein AB2689_27530 [Candidatus Thiodiazotropha taylori]